METSMALRLTWFKYVAFFCVISLATQLAKAGDDLAHHGKSNCTFHPDFSTVESSLRSAIFLADAKNAAQILSSRKLFSLGAGFQFRENERCLVIQTHDRFTDPDIVAARALALNAGKTGETEKLARAIVLSFDTDCQCSLYTPQEKEKLTAGFKAVLDDPAERKAIVEFGRIQGNRPPATNSTTSSGGRHLLQDERSVANSLVCAYCQPGRLCRNMGIRGCT